MKRRLIALLLCIAMIGSMTVYAVGDDTVCTCGTATEEHAAECALLAEPAPEPETEPETDPVCTCGTATETHAAECALYVAPAEPTCTCGTATEEHAAECPLYVAPAPVCTCGTTTEEHAAECPLYVAPAPVCTCGTTTEEHAVECALYVEPEAPSVADQLLAAESVEDMYMLMLGMMETDMDGLMALTRDEIKQIRARVAELDPESDDTDTQDLLDTLEVLPNGGEAESAYELIAAASSLSEMWAIMSDPANAEGVEALTYYEIEELLLRVEILFANIWEPTSEDANYRRMLDDKLSTLPVMSVSTYDIGNKTISENTTFTGGTDVANTSTTWTFTNNVTLTISNTITIPSGRTLTITGPGKVLRNTGNVPIFIVKSGGKLILNGVTIDGNNLARKQAAIFVYGSLEMSNSTIEKCVNTNSASGDNGVGGAIMFGAYSSSASSLISNSTITNCKARNGSAIMFRSNNNSVVRMENSYVTNCVAEVSNSDDFGGTIRTQGSANSQLTIYSCTISGNRSTDNGGGVYWNARGTDSSLTITGSDDKPTVISGNTAVDGGGVFISGSSITIKNTEITGNNATKGGGIKLEPFDYSTDSGKSANLTIGDGAKISGNIATEAGGAVYMDIKSASTKDGTKFYITIEGTALIENNEAPNGGAIAVTQKTGNKKQNGKTGSEKYHAYVNITGGTIQNNSASKNGGAVYIDRQYGNNGTAYDLQVNISGGSILNNNASGNGGAIYVADNATNATKTKVTVSGGSAMENEAVSGGAVYIKGGSFEMSGGTFKSNSAYTDGGAVYVTGGGVTMSGGQMANNKAAASGGAFFVSGGSVTMTGGTIGGVIEGVPSGNEAINGGGVFVDKGTFNMSNGTISKNAASNQGGAVYVNGGNVNIYHGLLNENRAIDGGAVYMAGSIQNTLTMESGQMIGNTASGNGGAICATNGIMKIGLLNCPGGSDQSKHTAKGDGRYHPQITNNEAAVCGGGIAITGQGVVHLYCGVMENNKALYKGVGLNVYMQAGEFYPYAGADIGDATDPDLVIVGGKLNDDTVTITYHYNFGNTDSKETGYADENLYMNLPSGEYIWKDSIPAGYRFFGWSPYPMDDAKVRDKDDYSPSGSPVKISDTEAVGKGQVTWDGTADKNMNLYALWAPDVNHIDYVVIMPDGTVVEPTHTPETYTFAETNQNIEIEGIAMPGYVVCEWYVYQDLNQEANWGLEPVFDPATSTKYEDLNLEAMKLVAGQYYDADQFTGDFTLTVPGLTFGDITLVAVMTPTYADLVIKKEVTDANMDPNQQFIIQIKGDPTNDQLADVDMEITINPNESVMIKHLPVGSYTVTEAVAWSWRYDFSSATVKYATDDEDATNGVSFSLNDPTKAEEVTFKNVPNPNKIYWLTGDSWCKNLWSDGIQVSQSAKNAAN